MATDKMIKIDTTVPSVARMYDYYLGGKDNYASDREACSRLNEIARGTGGLAINNRRWVGRSTKFVAERGVRQFIDFGTGLPTQDNVHQVARRIDPSARVVYIDNDPVVLRHATVQSLAEETQGNTAFILEDARNVDRVLQHEETRRLIDFSQPVAILFNSFLHCVKDYENPSGLVNRVMENCAPGSYIVISHLACENNEMRWRLTGLMQELTQGNWGRVRRSEEIKKFFNGMEIEEPGLCNITEWRPDGSAVEQTYDWIEFGGIARKA
jgi:hypothetical protein